MLLLFMVVKSGNLVLGYLIFNFVVNITRLLSQRRKGLTSEESLSLLPIDAIAVFPIFSTLTSVK